MKPTVEYKLKKESKWLTASAVMMGLAFFLQAFDFLGLRLIQGVDIREMIIFMILPMVLETVWCVYVRSHKEYSAKFGGVLGALLCIMVFVQTLFCGKMFLILLCGIACLLGVITLILITWGFIAHRPLGFMIFAAVVAIRVLLFNVIGYVTDLNWTEMLREVPVVAVLLSVTLFFGAIFPMRKE